MVSSLATGVVSNESSSPCRLMPTFLKSKKKRKRNASSDVSDGEPSPQGGLQDIDSILIQVCSLIS